MGKKMKVKEAYQEAYKELMEKGYNTQTFREFSEGVYRGVVYLHKKATWKSRVRVVYRVYKRGSRYLLIKDDKREFLEKYA
jgi:hypothetical protein